MMSKQSHPLDLNANSNKTSTVFESDGVELECLETQIGGHSSWAEKYSKTKLGLYDLKNGLVLKTLFPPPRGPRELKFYQRVFSSDCNDSDLVELRTFIPRFFGTEDRMNTTMMKLTNLAFPFKKPCVMDLKMGRITYDQEASAEKIHQEDAKFPPVKKTGFQITGMIIQNETEKKKIDKHYTRQLSEKTLVTDGLAGFFSALSSHKKKHVIRGLIARLKKLEAWFLKQRKFSFTASSLLIIYEGVNGKTMEGLPLNKNINTMCDSNEMPFDVCSSSELKVSTYKTSVHTSRKRSHSSDAAHEKKEDNFSGEKESSCNKILKDDKSDEGLSEIIKNSSGCSEKIDDSSIFNSMSLLHDETCEPVESCDLVPSFSAHLIDFAHVFPATDVDENFLFGLQNLISSLHKLTE